MSDNFIVSVSPHVKTPLDTAKAMRWVCVALLPTAVASVILFGLKSFLVILTSVATCVLTEYLCHFMFKKENSLTDYSAIVTGILFAFVLPPTTPLWMVIIGGFMAIFLVKQLFGGLGYNIFNPALAARAILLASWPVALTTWTKPFDAVTSASVLGILKEAQRVGDIAASASAAAEYTYFDLFLGAIPGSLGETCKLTLILGAALLFVVEVIDWYIPASFLGTVFVLSFAFGRDPLAAILSGGVMLGAFFMATDWVTTPTTPNGKLVFGFGCGLITALIRSYGGFPEGVCYSILFMNCLTPLIDKYIRPRVFGTKRAIFAGLSQK